MTISPRISVVMPAYNDEKFIGEAIESILAQTFTDFEFIIVDDGSTDNTSNIVKSYDDNRIRYIQHAENRGISEARNTGWQSALGDYIAIMDSDEKSDSERFSRQVEFLDAHPDVGVLGTQIYTIDDKKNISHGYHLDCDHNSIMWRILWATGPVVNASVMLRRQLYLDYGGYDSEIRSVDDYDFWCRVMWHTHFANLSERLHYRRVNLQSITHTYKRRSEEIQTLQSKLIHTLLNTDVPESYLRSLFQYHHGDKNTVSKDDLDGILWLTLECHRALGQRSIYDDGNMLSVKSNLNTVISRLVTEKTSTFSLIKQVIKRLLNRN